MQISKKQEKKTIDFNELISIYSDKYDVVHHVQINGEDYIFRILGRKEYKRILYNESYTELDMEDDICKTCVLWPEDLDLDEIHAGTPTELCRNILENSFLDDISSTLRLLEFYQDEMNDLENQMICIISEAFPSYTLEEIESWNNLKFCKMFSRAEWKFNNLKQSELKSATDVIRDVINLQEEGYSKEEIELALQEEYTEKEQLQKEPAMTFNSSESKEISRNGKNKMTPEKLMELKQRFPEIKWDQDNHQKEKVETNTHTHLPVAQRPGTWGLR